MADRDGEKMIDRDEAPDDRDDRADHELGAPADRSGGASKAPTSGVGVVVIGLGRFGGQVAESLVRLGHEVLGIDQDRDIVQGWAERITHVVQADATNNIALEQLGVRDFGRVVVGIGADLRASVLTVQSLAEIGVWEIWAKAATRKHGRILASLGATHVVYPEVAMGDRVAHLITSKMLDFVDLDHGFALAKTYLPKKLTRKSTAAAELARRHGVTVVAVRDPDGTFGYVPPDATVPPEAVVIVAGTTAAVQSFAAAI